MRGEDPAAIRILDIKPTSRRAILEKNIQFIQTDITDADAVLDAFRAPWSPKIQSLPLTVFHCVAYINSGDRKADFTSIYQKVNINGTENVVKAAKTAGASILIGTSSSSIGVIPTSYVSWPWEKIPKNYWQFLPNGDAPEPLIRPLNRYSSCYAWSKAQAENIVRQANDPTSNFLTGCIRPGHAIYGHGGAYEFSLTWNYLQRGGSPSWIHHIIFNLVNAQNVSIGHLAYENALLKPGSKPSTLYGNAYAVTDPNPAIRYGDFYLSLSTLVHPSTPVRFPEIPVLTLLLPAYALESYRLLRLRIPGLRAILPDLKGDIARIMPAMFQMCTLHTVTTDERARAEIGYVAPIESLEGIARAVLEWNGEVEERLKDGKNSVENGSVNVGMVGGLKESDVVPSPVVR